MLNRDDDKESFMATQSDLAKYNLPGAALSRELAAKITACTVASHTLQQIYGGILLRHKRTQQKTVQSKTSPRKVAFIGTVRERKGIPTPAKALRIFSVMSGIPLEFHLQGDVQLTELLTLLSANSVIVGDPLPLRDLPKDFGWYGCGYHILSCG